MARVQDLIERFYFGVPIGQRSLEAAIRDALSQKQTFALDAGCGIDAPLTRKFGNRVRVVGLDLCRGSLPIYELSREIFRGYRFVTAPSR